MTFWLSPFIFGSTVCLIFSSLVTISLFIFGTHLVRKDVLTFAVYIVLNFRQNEDFFLFLNQVKTVRLPNIFFTTSIAASVLRPFCVVRSV